MDLIMYYCISPDSVIEDKLKSIGVKYTVDENRLTFKLVKDSEKFYTMSPYLPNRCIKWKEYTQKELFDAEWLTFRSHNMKLDAMNDNVIEFRCPQNPNLDRSSYHKKQTMPFEFKPIKWKNNNHIYSSYQGGYYIMFCDDYAKDVIEKNKLSGLKFDKVIWYKKGISLPNAHQMCITNELENDSIVPDVHTTSETCPGCGKKIYITDSETNLQIKKSYLTKGIDFYTTSNIFGYGRHSVANPELLISDRAYRVFKDLGLTRNLTFEPVVLI